MQRIDWSLAACQGVNPDIFYDYEELRGKKQQESVEHAVQYCTPCPIKNDCLAHAIETEQLTIAHGIRGGMTASARLRLPINARRRARYQDAASA